MSAHSVSPVCKRDNIQATVGEWSVASQFASHLNGHFCVILYRSGYFILGIFDKGTLLVSRQEKRYTTRRKQGGAQHKKDNSTGKAISMGARLRRHNEELMQEFV